MNPSAGFYFWGWFCLVVTLPPVSRAVDSSNPTISLVLHAFLQRWYNIFLIKVKLTFVQLFIHSTSYFQIFIIFSNTVSPTMSCTCTGSYGRPRSGAPFDGRTGIKPLFLYNSFTVLLIGLLVLQTNKLLIIKIMMTHNPSGWHITCVISSNSGSA